MPITFQARLEPVDNALTSTIVRIPFDPVEAWPVRNKLRVKGAIRPVNSPGEPHAFASSLQGSPTRGYFLLATQKLRKAAQLAPGSLAEITLEPDLDGRAATPPPELAKLLRGDRTVKKWFEALPYSYRKYIAEQVAEPKSLEARRRRAEQWVERMMLTMEGEEWPPPILQAAFRRQPQARAGWDAMTANQRRAMLLSIFSCQSPEAQAKRVERALEDAMKAASRVNRVSRLKKRGDSEE